MSGSPPEQHGVAQRERDDNGVVELTGNRDEVRDEVEGSTR